MRKERAKSIKCNILNEMLDAVAVYLDEKSEHVLEVRSSKEMRLPFLIAFGNRELLMALPK